MSAFRIVLNRWAMTKLVRPFSRFSNACWINRSVRVSTLEVASSRIKILGLRVPPCNGKQLPLSLAESASPFTQDGLVLIWQAFDEAVCP